MVRKMQCMAARVLAVSLVVAVWLGAGLVGVAAASEDVAPSGPGGPAGASGTVALALEPGTLCGRSGDTFVLTLNSHAGAQAWATMDADIRFPSGVLQVVDASGAEATQIEVLAPVNNVIINQVDKTAGKILFGTGIAFGGSPVSGDTPLATIRFRALQAGPIATIHFASATVADISSKWVTGSLWDATLLMGPTAAPDVDIRKEGNDAALEWGAAPGAVSYQVWRKAAPYVTPAGPADFSTTAPEWPDPGALLVVDSRYYTVRTDAGCQTSGFSNETGKFSFKLTPGQG